MHRARENVNPMLALRTIVRSGRRDEAWPRICRRLRADEQAPPPAAPTPRPRLIVDGRPTADHPWRRPFLRGGREAAAS